MTSDGRLVLVRHAMPDVDPRVPAHRWELGAEGRAAARRLAALIGGRVYWVASDEPKAEQTMHEMSGAPAAVVSDSGFGEVCRPEVWTDDYRATARAYVEGQRLEGWEPHGQVAGRFDAAVERHAAPATAHGATLVVGTHGLASTVWLSARLQLQPCAGDFWAALSFPDVFDVDLGAGTTCRRC